MEAQSRPDSATILLVENEYALRELMRRFLQSLGYTVLDAKDGDHALAVASSHPTPIDLLLTDIVMPGLSGFGLEAEIREIRAETKVLYFSGYANDYNLVRDGLDHSGKPFLLKPFAQADLINKVREVLGSPPAALT